MPFDTFASTVSCIHQPLFLGYTLKSVIDDPKVLPLNSYSRENKQELFLRLVPKRLCRTQGFMSVTEIVNHMFIFLRFH